MKVLFVAWRDLAHPKAGGSEVAVDMLAKGLMARGHDVSLMCSGPVEPHPYPVIENGSTYSQYALAPLRYARHFRDVDLVVDVVNGMPFFSPLWRRGPRLCLLHHVHGDQWQQYFPGPVATAAASVERRGLPLVYRNTHFLTISPSTARELVDLGIGESRVHLVYLGVDTEMVRNRVPRSREPKFVALGRLAPNKRLDLLLDLWARVGPKVGGTLTIAGDGPEAAHIAERVRTEPDLRSVVLEGRITERRKAELLSEAWLIVHTSEREGWGLVLLEAGLFGTPTLAYRVPGVMDAVIDGETGVLVDADDDFVDQWVALAGDPRRLAELGEAAAPRAGGFTWDRSVDAFLDAASAAIAGHQATEGVESHG